MRSGKRRRRAESVHRGGVNVSPSDALTTSATTPTDHLLCQNGHQERYHDEHHHHHHEQRPKNIRRRRGQPDRRRPGGEPAVVLPPFCLQQRRMRPRQRLVSFCAVMGIFLLVCGLVLCLLRLPAFRAGWLNCNAVRIWYHVNLSIASVL